MSDAMASQARLAELETDGATGCLTIKSSTGQVGHVYLLMGRPFHADSPLGEGDIALAEALNWPDVVVSFETNAHLPAKQTIATTPTTAAAPPRSDRLETDPRIFAMSCLSLGGAALAILLPISLTLIGAAIHSDSLWKVAVIFLFVFLAMWLIGSIGFRIVFLQEAVKVSDGVPKTEIPNVIDASGGVISGQPDLAAKLIVRCLTGRVGKCWVELYPEGLQIWRGPERPEPRWQFAYSDLSAAELVDVAANNGRTILHRHYVRLIVAKPRMAFLFKDPWLQPRNAVDVFKGLAEHKVVTTSEELDC